MRLSGNWTIASWAYLSSTSGTNPIMLKMGSSNGHENYEMRLNSGKLICRGHNTSGTNYQTSSSQTLSTGKWYFLACVHGGDSSGNNGQITSWINGLQDSSVAFSGSPCTQCVIGTASAFNVGAMGPDSGCPGCLSYHLNGKEDDVRVYASALSSTQIFQLFESYNVSTDPRFDSSGEQRRSPDPSRMRTPVMVYFISPVQGDSTIAA